MSSPITFNNLSRRVTKGRTERYSQFRNHSPVAKDVTVFGPTKGTGDPDLTQVSAEQAEDHQSSTERPRRYSNWKTEVSEGRTVVYALSDKNFYLKEKKGRDLILVAYQAVLEPLVVIKDHGSRPQRLERDFTLRLRVRLRSNLSTKPIPTRNIFASDDSRVQTSQIGKRQIPVVLHH